MCASVTGRERKNNLWSPIKTITSGTLWLLVACWLLWEPIGSTIAELALIRHGVTAPAFITDAWEDVEEGDDGRAHWFYDIVYTYRIPDGREFSGRVHGSGRLREEIAHSVYLGEPYPIDVEYLPHNPTVSRPKGHGSQTVVEWILRKIGAGSLLLALWCSPGVYLIWAGLRDLRRLAKSSRPQSESVE